MPASLNRIIYFLFFACAIALLITIQQCRNSVAGERMGRDYISSLSDTITYLRHGIAQKPAVEVTRDQFEAVLKDNEFLKVMLKEARLKAGNVKQSTKVTTDVVIGKPIDIPFADTVPCPDFKAIGFSIDSGHYRLSGRIFLKHLSIEDIGFPDTLYVITATKGHLFRKNEYLVSVKHSNPYVKTTGLTNLTIKEERKWWQSGWLKFGAGVATGVLLLRR